MNQTFSKYISQRRHWQFLEIPLFNFSFELWKSLFLLSQEAEIPKFVDVINLNF